MLNKQETNTKLQVFQNAEFGKIRTAGTITPNSFPVFMKAAIHLSRCSFS